MKPVFADTGFFLALLNSRDQHHRRAVELNGSLAAPLVTTNWVLLEVANALSATRSRAVFAQLRDRLRSTPGATILPADENLFDAGCSLYSSRPDKEWSLTDCISFVAMSGEELSDALTADHHFEQAGFHALMHE